MKDLVNNPSTKTKPRINLIDQDNKDNQIPYNADNKMELELEKFLQDITKEKTI